MPNFTEKPFKTIINKMKHIDSWFWCRYTLNPYNGCQFGCIYCDSRSAKYHLPTDFENEITVKENAVELLEARLSRMRAPPDVIALGGTTDAYQPAEKRFENTRKCLEVLKKHDYPALVITKSDLVTRDADLLADIGKKTWATVGFTLTTLDSDLARFLEHRTPTPEKRLEALADLAEVDGIQTGVMFMPIVPFLCDSKENIEEVIEAVSCAGADFLLFAAGITMRDLQATWFLKHLGERDLGLVKKYQDLFMGGYTPKHKDYMQKINRTVLKLCKKYDLPVRMKRYIPNDHRRVAYLVAQDILNDAYEKQLAGEPHKDLYWAGMEIQELKEPLEDVAARRELQKITNVGPKMEAVIMEKLESYAAVQRSLFEF